MKAKDSNEKGAKIRQLTKKDLMRLKGGSTIVCNNYRTEQSLCDGNECKTRCAPMNSAKGGTIGVGKPRVTPLATGKTKTKTTSATTDSTTGIIGR